MWKMLGFLKKSKLDIEESDKQLTFSNPRHAT